MTRTVVKQRWIKRCYTGIFVILISGCLNSDNCEYKINKDIVDDVFVYELVHLKIKLEESFYLDSDKNSQDSLKLAFIQKWKIYKLNSVQSLKTISSICNSEDNQLFQVTYNSPFSSKISPNKFLTCIRLKKYLLKLLEVKDDSTLIKSYISYDRF